MARSSIPITVTDAAGNAVANASVRIQSRSSGTDAVLYTSETGPTAATNPVLTDAAGRVGVWVNRGSYNAIVSGTGFTSYTQAIDIVPNADDVGNNIFPTSPTVGQRYTYNAGNNTLWEFMYGGPNWSFIGGAPFIVGGGSVGLDTGLTAPFGNAVAVPFVGGYKVDITGQAYVPVPAGSTINANFGTRVGTATSSGGTLNLPGGIYVYSSSNFTSSLPILCSYNVYVSAANMYITPTVQVVNGTAGGSLASVTTTVTPMYVTP
jgi:hypothetical protein